MSAIWDRHKKKILPFAILLIGIAIFAILRLTKPAVEAVAVPERSWPVAVQEVQFEDHRPRISSFGEIRTGSDGQLRARVPGAVQEIMPGLGDGSGVVAGETLIIIDDFDYRIRLEEREADFAEAQARLEELTRDLATERELLPLDEQQVSLARREVARQEKLLKSSAGRRKTYDDSLVALNERKSQLLLRQQKISRLETQILQSEAALTRTEAALRSAKRDLEETRIKAPFSGFIGELLVGLGQEITTSEKIADLIALNRLEVGFHLSEGDFARLNADGSLIGRDIEVVLRQGRSETTYPAHVTRFKANISADSAGRTIFAAFPTLALDTKLRPGLFVEVHIPERLYSSVVRIPVEAVHQNRFVYLVENERLISRDVEIIDRFGDYYLIEGGLQAGDQVCLTRFAEMGSGIKVSIP